MFKTQSTNNKQQSKAIKISQTQSTSINKQTQKGSLMQSQPVNKQSNIIDEAAINIYMHVTCQ